MFFFMRITLAPIEMTFSSALIPVADNYTGNQLLSHIAKIGMTLFHNYKQHILNIEWNGVPLTNTLHKYNVIESSPMYILRSLHNICFVGLSV